MYEHHERKAKKEKENPGVTPELWESSRIPLSLPSNSRHIPKLPTLNTVDIALLGRRRGTPSAVKAREIISRLSQRDNGTGNPDLPFGF